MNRFDHGLWGEVVADGPAHCHWGGRAQSERLVQILEPRQEERILELCCGQGGLLALLRPANSYGVDVAEAALAAAKQNNSQARLVCADARYLPFSSETFDKVVSQDADVWMTGRKGSLIREISRVTAPSGLLVWETYAEHMPLTRKERSHTTALLRSCGYEDMALPHADDIHGLLKGGGFRVLRQRSLHDLYRRDNQGMIQKIERRGKLLSTRFPQETVAALSALLKWEHRLFARRKWTGLLIVARKG